MIDNEDRSLKLPLMSAPRTERLLWLEIRIASVRTSQFCYLDYANILRSV